MDSCIDGALAVQRPKARRTRSLRHGHSKTHTPYRQPERSIRGLRPKGYLGALKVFRGFRNKYGPHGLNHCPCSSLDMNSNPPSAHSHLGLQPDDDDGCVQKFRPTHTSTAPVDRQLAAVDSAPVKKVGRWRCSPSPLSTWVGSDLTCPPA